ncbi:MAG: GDSL-type esterase/lipase family protein [Anaerolineae bacterium]|jgi:lysophospholipase L1-like esterase|nr:GDSL-type esterase/lipase family protein [Anaerolineae bacterium]
MSRFSPPLRHRWRIPGGLLLCLLLCLPLHAQDAVVRPMDSNLRLRAAPLEQTDIVGSLPPDTPLHVLSRSGDSRWLEVATDDGRRGWVDAAFVRLLVAPESLPVNPAYAVPLDVAALVTGITPHLRQVYEHGQRLGNRANVFSRAGDSITAATHTLYPVGEGLMIPGAYTYLQPVVDFYRGGLARTDNAFSQVSLAAQIGWTTTMLLDPAHAPDLCQAGENALRCELRLTRPAVLLVMFGTNDVEVMPPGAYRANMEQITQLALAQGVIPVLTTIPPRPGYETAVTDFNRVLRETARAYGVPLLDYYAALAPLPGFGLDVDRVHPNIPPLGYAGAADFRTPNLAYGYVLRNLTLLHALDALWRTILQPAAD